MEGVYIYTHDGVLNSGCAGSMHAIRMVGAVCKTRKARPYLSKQAECDDLILT
jgi:hypothetical protein